MKARQFSLIILSIFLTACGMSENVEEAEKFMKAYFEHRIKQDSMGEEKFYSTIFTDATTPEEWNNIKSLVVKAHGKLVSYQQLNWQYKSMAHTSELSGTFVFFDYKTVYENGEGMESFTVFKNSDHPKFKIIRHNFNSAKIQELVSEGIQQATKTPKTRGKLLDN